MEPALYTTFDTSLIDLSQHLRLHPSQSFSTTESVGSLDVLALETQAQATSSPQLEDWKRATIDAVHQLLPRFISILNEAVAIHEPGQSTEITVAAFETDMIDELDELRDSWERQAETSDSAHTVKYSLLDGETWSNADSSVLEEQTTKYNGAVILFGSDTTAAREKEARIVMNMLKSNSVALICQIQSIHCSPGKPVDMFEEAGYALEEETVSSLTGNDLQMRASILQRIS
jgi:hypothetical protein